MLTREQNERMTQTGAETPMGKMLRRYWQVIGIRSELDQEPVQPIRILGENLTLFKTERGELGLIGERCAHRAISLAYGIPQENGLRCAYHGWIYDTEGHVIDMPFEPACLPLKITSYPVEEMGGLIWAYLGPEPRPLLPRFAGFVRDDVDRTITTRALPCNWVQCMDNSMDPLHFEYLHAHYGNYYNGRRGLPPVMNTPRHLKIDFDVFEYGIYKRRLLEGESEDCDDWRIGHPVLFPNILQVGGGGRFNYQIRIPIDDVNTLHLVYGVQPREPGAEPKPLVVNREAVLYDDRGLVDAPNVLRQDEMAWIGQNSISDRTMEHLVTSDKGVMLYHNLLFENIAKVERGEDPMGTVRDPAKNFPMIDISIEGTARAPFALAAAGR